MSKKKLISVIIPVFNRAGSLVRAVSSILKQDYRPIEIIIIDDGSTDETVDVIRELCQKHPKIIRSISQVNQGPGIARQTGLKIAGGDFVQYLDSDDIILPGKFLSQLRILSENPDCSVALGLTHGIPMNTGAGKTAKEFLEHVDYLYPAILNYRWWTTSTPLYRSDAAHYAEWTDVAVLEDWEYEFQIAARGEKYCFSPEYFVDKSNDSDDQLSRYKQTNREFWLESKARVMEHIVDIIFEMELDQRNLNIKRFINKIINTGEEALAFSRVDISKQMSVLAIRSMRHNICPNFIKRILKLYMHSLLSVMK